MNGTLDLDFALVRHIPHPCSVDSILDAARIIEAESQFRYIPDAVMFPLGWAGWVYSGDSNPFAGPDTVGDFLQSRNFEVRFGADIPTGAWCLVFCQNVDFRDHPGSAIVLI
jgi:hypothetical protein